MTKIQNITAKNKLLTLDEQQKKLAARLADMANSLENNNKISIARFFQDKKTIPSLYIYGSVGCGKTMLMQKFYDKIEVRKKYFHFHDFLYQIHHHLFLLRQEKKHYHDELIESLKRILHDVELLCLDEFQVLDIADAMIIGRVFTYIFNNNIKVVFTSNSHPQDLYKNGLQRELFLEFVNNILLKDCEIIKLESNIDYRLLFHVNFNKRYLVENKKNHKLFLDIITDFTEGHELEPREIKVWGREVIINKTYKKIAIFDFFDLCATNLGVSDYRKICEEFNLIFLENLPYFTKENRNEAQRFTLLIDEVYEKKTALIILAKAKIDRISNNLSDDKSQLTLLPRTISRLKEIKSDFYWKNSKFNLK